MNVIKSERGYALLLVLLTIVIIGIFVPVIMSNIFSSSAQYQKTEKRIQHNKLTEMGEIYLVETVKELLENWEFQDGWQPSDWDDLTEEQKFIYVKNLIIISVETELSSKLGSPQFRSNGYHFEIDSYNLPNTGNLNDLEIQFTIFTTINGGIDIEEFSAETTIPIVISE